MTRMRVSAKVDYALRATGRAARPAPPGPVKGERLATAQEIPLKFLENILLELRRRGIVASQRGAEGGYWLARPADEITLADVIRAVEGPIANVRGARPEDVALHRRRRAAARRLDRAAHEHARRARDGDARRPRRRRLADEVADRTTAKTRSLRRRAT